MVVHRQGDSTPVLTHLHGMSFLDRLLSLGAWAGAGRNSVPEPSAPESAIVTGAQPVLVGIPVGTAPVYDSRGVRHQAWS